MRVPAEAAAWESDAAYRYGAKLYVEGFFWEAHEVWEAVWKASRPNGVERRLLRGLIQLANAALKVRMDRVNAALRLIAEADALLGEAGAAAQSDLVMGVAVAPLRATARELAAAIRAGGGGGEVARILHPLGAVADDWTIR